MRMSHKRAAALGWRRTDDQQHGKCGARWEHVSGLVLVHCGHPTALWPWGLYSRLGDHLGQFDTLDRAFRFAAVRAA